MTAEVAPHHLLKKPDGARETLAFAPRQAAGRHFADVVIGVLVASAITDASDFGTQEAWFYVTLLTVGYMVSRGLAKSGSRDFYDDDTNSH